MHPCLDQKALKLSSSYAESALLCLCVTEPCPLIFDVSGSAFGKCNEWCAAALQIGQPTLPLTHNLFNFGSWMGGDRDGNPYVKADTTRDVVINARLAAVNAFFNSIEELMFELSIWRCNTEMQVRASTHLDPVPRCHAVRKWHASLQMSLRMTPRESVP